MCVLLLAQNAHVGELLVSVWGICVERTVRDMNVVGNQQPQQQYSKLACSYAQLEAFGVDYEA